ncbi:peptidoglycan DD-metalloendopeptidase family protein [Candidatus Curtissbacteria bacterium]|nr:peptidoglycan DD-metalloendopeptidase family protein [Candidatus Curtissbacteria bacterium]
MLDRDPLHRDFPRFFIAFFSYIRLRLKSWGTQFENVKDVLVDVLMVRRGAHTALFVHLCVVFLAIGALLTGGVFTSGAVVSGSYPGIGANPLVAGASTKDSDQGVISSQITPVTVISEKPRDKVIEYEVKSGDTISGIAKDYGISDNTILWANDLTSNSQLKAGEKIKILPVSGVAHKVEGGDSIYSVAKKYQANAQAVIDFPFNDIGDDFSLRTGQTLIVPDGAPPAAPKPAPTQYLAQQNIPVESLGNGQFIWPAAGTMNQYFSWYHPGIDIGNLGGGPIHASDSGTVVAAGWDATGYGNRVIIDHGNGYQTLYAHQSALYVSNGQKVAKGDVIGMMGSTGRSTGTHLHFEVRRSGAANVNPLAFLGSR